MFATCFFMEIMMMDQLKLTLSRLKKPSVIISLVSQIAPILILLGFNIDEHALMTVTYALCSILVTLGILSNPDTNQKGYSDDLLTCSNDGLLSPHVMVNGQMVCKNCGAVYQPQGSKGS